MHSSISQCEKVFIPTSAVIIDPLKHALVGSHLGGYAATLNHRPSSIIYSFVLLVLFSCRKSFSINVRCRFDFINVKELFIVLRLCLFPAAATQAAANPATTAAEAGNFRITTTTTTIIIIS